MNRWQFSIGTGNFGRHFDVYAFRPTTSGLEVGTRLLLEKLTEDQEADLREPTIRLTHEEAQALFDELHRNGFRPTHQVDEAGALKATERHLADLQRLLGLTPPTPIVEESRFEL